MNDSPGKICVVGLGYVGLPLALRLADVFDDVLGFDANHARVHSLKAFDDRTGETSVDRLKNSSLRVTSDAAEMEGVTVFIVAVPTPILPNKHPDLSALEAATRTVAQYLKPGGLVIYESTVYPGVTNDICMPLLERHSGLRQGIDFGVGYSPERINPGDSVHTLESVVKVVSADDADTLARVVRVYEPAIDAGLHIASSIRVAEAAKVIENTQRDLNIALMNELALIFDRLGLNTADVLAAAASKWNFIPFHPGLVGGHCIGVDPYYLTARAEAVGYHPQVILAGRRINDAMGPVVARKTIKLLIEAGARVRGARVGVLGVTYKGNVSDARNSRVPDLVGELEDFGCLPIVHDPLADPELVAREYRIVLHPEESLTSLDAVIIAVDHRPFRDFDHAWFVRNTTDTGVIIDVYGLTDADSARGGRTYWRL